jgi:hypothetical protein
MSCGPSAIQAHAGLDHGNIRPVFSGRTSLSTGWGLIKRFSEDVDFKLAMPAASTPSKARTQRSAYREKVWSALGAAGFEPVGSPVIGKNAYAGAGERCSVRTQLMAASNAVKPIRAT